MLKEKEVIVIGIAEPLQKVQERGQDMICIKINSDPQMVMGKEEFFSKNTKIVPKM